MEDRCCGLERDREAGMMSIMKQENITNPLLRDKKDFVENFEILTRENENKRRKTKERKGGIQSEVYLDEKRDKTLSTAMKKREE